MFTQSAEFYDAIYHFKDYRREAAGARRVGKEGVAVLPFHYLVATPRGVRHFTERHELAMFTHEQHRRPFARPDSKPPTMSGGWSDRDCPSASCR